MYSEAYRKYSVMIIENLIRNICVYTDFWVAEQLCAIPEQDICNKVVNSSTKETQLNLNGDWFRNTLVTRLEEQANVILVRL